ncbi:MAG: GNAT family N-acetyltransferase [Candidatus Zixiibacteriota bacterium]|nr:MAG: GNAT family N-acetyltransferase [candidate division Zixibacteria bacterium]
MAQEIKRLDIDAYDEIIRVWAESGLPFKLKGRDSLEAVAKEMANPNCAFFGLFLDEKMIGVVIANFDGRRGWINRLAIDPDQRGLGLAAKLIEISEEFLRSAGAVVICALIEEINYPSISCFQNSGYTCEPNIKYFTKRPSPDA